MWKLNLFLVAFVISYLLTPKILNMLQSGGLTRNNFHGRIIPSTAGIIFPCVLAVTYLLFPIIFDQSFDSSNFLGFVSLISLVGLVDDVAGNRNDSGFKGHFSCLIKQKRITTGVWKAGIGGVVAALATINGGVSWWDIIINTILVALSTNLFNLLDLRPGRSIKAFFTCTIFIILLIPSYTANVLLLPLAGAVGAYAVYDLKGKAMMGDSGSNVIGLVIGLCVMAGGNITVRITMLVFFLIMHLISEYRSFSEIIEKNKVLCFFDQLGRRE